MGDSITISKQSIIVVNLGNLCLNTGGIVRNIFSLFAIWIRNFNFIYIISIHFQKCLMAAGEDPEKKLTVDNLKF